MTTTPLLLCPAFDAAPSPATSASVTVLQGDAGTKPAPLPGGAEGGAGSPAGQGGGGGGLGSFLPFIVIGVVFWFLIIGPERKNRRKRDEMLKALKKGDKVMTTGGLYGKVAELRDDVVVLDAGDVRLKFARAAIQGVVEGGD